MVNLFFFFFFYINRQVVLLLSTRPFLFFFRSFETINYIVKHIDHIEYKAYIETNGTNDWMRTYTCVCICLCLKPKSFDSFNILKNIFAMSLFFCQQAILFIFIRHFKILPVRVKQSSWKSLHQWSDRDIKNTIVYELYGFFRICHLYISLFCIWAHRMVATRNNIREYEHSFDAQFTKMVS